MKKKLTVLFLAVAMCMTMSAPAFASDSILLTGEYITQTEEPSLDVQSINGNPIQPNNEPVTYGWEIISTTPMGTTSNGEAKEVVGSFVATRDGQRCFAEGSYSKSGKISGTVKVAYKLIEAQIDIEIGEEYTFALAGISDALKAGEEVLVYAQPNYAKTQVFQKEFKIDQAGRKSYTGNTAICYTLKPIAPQVSFKYL